MTSVPTYNDFAARFPDLATADSARQAWIAARLTSDWNGTSAAAWGGLHSEAVLLKVAHRYALRLERERRGATGKAVEVKTKHLSVKWGNTGSSAADGDAYWQRSGYGEEYLELRDTTLGSGPSWGIA